MAIKVALGNVFLFSPVSDIPPVLPAHLFIYKDNKQLTIYSVIKHNTYTLFYVAVCDFFLCYSPFLLGTLLVMYTPVCARMLCVCSDFDTPVSELCGLPYVSDPVAQQEGCDARGGSGVQIVSRGSEAYSGHHAGHVLTPFANFPAAIFQWLHNYDGLLRALHVLER